MQYISTKQFRDLCNKQQFKITAVYGPYRSGGLEIGGKYVGRTFKYDKDGRLKENKWNKELRTFEMLDIKDIKIDKDFFKTYKKVFDLVIQLEQPISFTNWKGEVVEDYEFTVNAFSAAKIKDILTATIIDEIPTNEDGTPIYDWEDNAYQDLAGVVVKMSVTGQKLDTKYIFKEGKNFKEYGQISDEIGIEDIPF